MPSPSIRRVARPATHLAALLLACATVSACSDTTAAPSPGPSVVLSTAMPSLALAQADSASVDVTIMRTGGFSGRVTLTVSGAPVGVTVAVPPNPVAGSSASLNLRVADATMPGAYPLTLTAAGDGISTQTLPLDLQVALRMPLWIAVPYYSGLEPYWVAFQDGNGAWRQAEPSIAGGTITFRADFSTNRGAMATLHRLGGDLTALSVLYGTPAELMAVGDTNPRDCGPVESKTLFGAVAGLDTNEFALISAANGVRARVSPDQGETFLINAVPGGPQDFLATRTTRATGSEAITRMIMRRGLDLPDNATLPVFDFAAPEAFAPAVANVTLTGLSASGSSGGTSVRTSHSEIPVTAMTNQTTDAIRPYVALPEAQLHPGELQILFASANPTGSAEGRAARLYFRAPTDRTLALGAPLMTPTFITIATAPALRLRARFVPQTDYDRSASISYQQGATTFVAVTMTADYAALAGSGYDLQVPDLSRAAGFDPAWALRPGGTLLWAAGRSRGTLGFGPNATPTDGATQRIASAAGSIDAAVNTGLNP